MHVLACEEQSWKELVIFDGKGYDSHSHEGGFDYVSGHEVEEHLSPCRQVGVEEHHCTLVSKDLEEREVLQFQRTC